MTVRKLPRVLNDRGTWRNSRAKRADFERRRFKEDTGLSTWEAVRSALQRGIALASPSRRLKYRAGLASAFDPRPLGRCPASPGAKPDTRAPSGVTMARINRTGERPGGH